MHPYALLFLVTGLGVIAWLTGRARAARFGAASKHRLHSLPGQHGIYVAMWTVIPALIFVLAWSVFTPNLATEAVLKAPQAIELPAFGYEREAILNEVRARAAGGEYGFYPLAEQLAPLYAQASRFYGWLGSGIAILLAFACGAFAYTRVKADFRARTRVERSVMLALLVASLIAILTTLGIFLSLLFESVRFFAMVPVTDFLFGTLWSPQVIDPADPGRR